MSALQDELWKIAETAGVAAVVTQRAIKEGSLCGAHAVAMTALASVGAAYLGFIHTHGQDLQALLGKDEASGLIGDDELMDETLGWLREYGKEIGMEKSTEGWLKFFDDASEICSVLRTSGAK